MGIKASSNKIEHIKKSVSTSSDKTVSLTPTSPLDIEVEYLETFIIVWLDANIGVEQNQVLQKRLRQYVTFLVTFNDIKLCEQWLQNRSMNDKILLIVPGELGRMMVPNIYQITSIIAIYVFCWTPENHFKWTQNYPKIRRVISKSDQLLQKISNDQIHFENIEDSKAIQIFKDRCHSRVLDRENASFLWYQLFLDILISSSYLPSPTSSGELIRILRRFSSDDNIGLNLIKQFEETYDQQKAVTWLINNTALSRFLNKALREQNISMLFYLRFFLFDIYNQLTTNQSRSERVYRKQLMASGEIENIKANINQYLIFNGFLLTSTQHPDISSIDNTDNQFQTVIMEINADDLIGNIPFAYLQTMADTASTSAILFMCGSVFKIISFKKNQNSTWTLHLSLTGLNDLNILTEKKQKLRENKNLLMIADLLDQCNQSNKAIVYCQHLLRELPSNHILVPQLTDKINISSKLQEVSLGSTQFILIDLSTRLSPLASAMLNALHLLTNHSILIHDNSSKIDFDTMSKKTLLLFTSSQTFSSMSTKLEQFSKLFILGKDIDKVDQQQRFDNSEDLIFQLADELYHYYKLEAGDDLRSGGHVLAKEKEELANRIHNELKKVHQNFCASNIDNKPPICTTTTLVWLTPKKTNNDSMNRLQHLFKDIISSFTIFDDEQQCYLHICTTEFNHIVFLIIDTCYKESSIIGFPQLTNIKKLYRYGQSTTEIIIDTHHEFTFQLTHDLIDHYNKLGNECNDRNNVKKGKEIFLKAHDLCKRLIEI